MPLVGVVVGGIAGGLGWLGSLVLPPLLAVVVAFGASVVLTGAIHWDGFLDACDALFASVPPERRFVIFKDPRHGTFALAGFAVAVPAWLAALAAIPPAAWPGVLAFCGGASRTGAVLNALRLPYGSGGSATRAFSARPSLVLIGVGALAAALCCLAHPWLAVLLVPAAVAALGLGEWCARRLDGVLVGDCYGAIVIVLEVALLAACASALAPHGSFSARPEAAVR